MNNNNIFNLYSNLHILNKVLGQISDIDWEKTPRLIYMTEYPLFEYMQLLSKSIDNYICSIHYEMDFPKNKFSMATALEDFIHHHHRKIMEVNFVIAEYLFTDEHILGEIYKSNINDLINLDSNNSFKRDEKIAKFDGIKRVNKRNYHNLIEEFKYEDPEYKLNQLNWYKYSVNTSHYSSYNTHKNVSDFINQDIITLICEVNYNVIQYVVNSILLITKKFPKLLDEIGLTQSFLDDFLSGKVLDLAVILPYHSLGIYYKEINVFDEKDDISHYVMIFIGISTMIGRKAGYKQSYISNSFHTLIRYIKRFSYCNRIKEYDCLLTDSRKIFELFASIYYLINSDEETCELYARYLDARKYEESEKQHISVDMLEKIPEIYKKLIDGSHKIEFDDKFYTIDEFYKYNISRINEILGSNYTKTENYMWLYKYFKKSKVTVKEYIVGALKELITKEDYLGFIEYMYVETSIYQHPSLYNVSNIYNDLDAHMKKYYDVIYHLCEVVVQMIYKCYKEDREIYNRLRELENILQNSKKYYKDTKEI